MTTSATLLLLGAERVDEAGWSDCTPPSTPVIATTPDRHCYIGRGSVPDVYLTDDVDLAAGRLDKAIAWCAGSASGPEPGAPGQGPAGA